MTLLCVKVCEVTSKLMKFIDGMQCKLNIRSQQLDFVDYCCVLSTKIGLWLFSKGVLG